VLALGSLAAYGFQAFNLTLAGDDWMLWDEASLNVTFGIQLGRWFQLLVDTTLANALFAPTFTMIAFVLCVITAGFVQAEIIGLKSKLGVMTYTSALLFHPFWVETASFKLYHISTGIAILLATAAAALVVIASENIVEKQNFRSGVFLLFAASLTLSFVVSIQQTYLFFAVSTCGFWVLNKVTVQPDLEVRDMFSYIAIILVMILGAIVLYVIEIEIARALYRVDPMPADHPYALGGSLVSSVAELQVTLTRLVSVLTHYLFLPQHFIPMLTKYIFLAALLFYTVRSVSLAASHNLYRAVIVILGIIALLVMPWSLGIIRVPSPYRYTALVSNIAVYSGILAFAVQYAPTDALRKLFAIGASLIVIIFIFQHNSVAHTTYTLNQQDRSIATRILDRLETNENFPNLVAQSTVNVITMGRLNTIQPRPFDNDELNQALLGPGISGCGVYSCQPIRQYALLNTLQAHSINYRVAYVESFPRERQIVLRAFIAEMEPWPHESSVYITDQNEVIIVLSK